MSGSTAKVMLGFLGAGALLVGLSGPAMGQAPQSAGPSEDVQATIARVRDVRATLRRVEQRLESGANEADFKEESLDGLAAQLAAIETFIDTNFTRLLAERFNVLFGANGDAVMDNTTALVWEREPYIGRMDWREAVRHCDRREVDGQKNYILPTWGELESLMDKTGPGRDRLFLPEGHPFGEMQLPAFWSRYRQDNDRPTKAGMANFNGGTIYWQNKDETYRAWCVRDDSIPDEKGVPTELSTWGGY